MQSSLPRAKAPMRACASSLRKPARLQRNTLARFQQSEIPDWVSQTVDKQTKKLFINGEYVDAVNGSTYDNVCPLNEQSMGTVAEGDEKDIDRAVQAAQDAFQTGPWATMSSRQRGRLLFKFADLLEQHKEEFATLEAVDNGKPYSVALANDVPLAVDCFRFFAGLADKTSGRTVDTDDGTLCTILKEPIGVVGAIVPWNYPLVMLAWKAAPALAAGCTLVLKCAEMTPLSALRAAELAHQAGIPAGVFNVVVGPGSTAGAALAKHPQVDKVCFTGSTKVGKLIAESAAATVKSISLELGGKSPLIIAEDADLEKAADVAFLALFFNHGQNCCAGSRIFVHESIYEAFIEKAVERANNTKVGNPFDEDTYQGPQIGQQQFEKILKYIDSGKEQGAKMVCGGERAFDTGYYVKPTIFRDVEDDMDISKDEIFGPVMVVTKYSDLDEAIRRGNNTKYGLAAGIVSNNINTVNKAVKGLKAGTIWVNTWNTFDPAAPFGGYKESGIHRDKGIDCMDNYMEMKTVTMPKPC